MTPVAYVKPLMTLRCPAVSLESVQRTAILLVVGVVLLLAAPASAAVRTPARAPALYKNCTALNKKYPHGVGRANARDKTSGEPVTTFKRSNNVYRVAMSYNKGRTEARISSVAADYLIALHGPGKSSSRMMSPADSSPEPSANEVPGNYVCASARLVSGGPARTVGLYSTSCSRPSKVRLPSMSRETSG